MRLPFQADKAKEIIDLLFFCHAFEVEKFGVFGFYPKGLTNAEKFFYPQNTHLHKSLSRKIGRHFRACYYEEMYANGVISGSGNIAGVKCDSAITIFYSELDLRHNIAAATTYSQYHSLLESSKTSTFDSAGFLSRLEIWQKEFATGEDKVIDFAQKLIQPALYSVERV